MEGMATRSSSRLVCDVPSTSPCCSAAQSCPTLCDPWTAARQAPLCSTVPQSLLRFTSPSHHCDWRSAPLDPPPLIPPLPTLLLVVTACFPRVSLGSLWVSENASTAPRLYGWLVQLLTQPLTTLRVFMVLGSITVSPIKPAQVFGNGARADLLACFLATQKLQLVFALTSMSPSAFNFLFGRVLGSCNEGEKKNTKSSAVVFTTSIFLAVIALFLFITTFV